MKNVRKILAALIVSICIFSSCKKDIIYGTGSIESQERNVAVFTKVKTDGEDIDVIISQGATQKLVVSEYSNLINDIETIVAGDELLIRYRTNRNVLNNKSKVIITMPVLNAVYTGGSADIQVNGAFVANNTFTATTRGSGDINLNRITAIDFNIITAGSGDVNVTNAQTKNTDISITGSSDVNAFGLKSNNAIVETSGSGDVKVSVTLQLNAILKGSGDIYYRGNPAVSKSITGEGSVIRD